jgi:hypothetical protein
LCEHTNELHYSHLSRHDCIFANQFCLEGYAGIEFIDENGGGPGVRLQKPLREKLRK